jgi:hypothetical protein
MVRWLLAACAALFVGACSCQPKLSLDAGFECGTDADCAEGFTCFDRLCVQMGSHVGGGRGGGGATGGGDTGLGGGSDVGGGVADGGGSDMGGGVAAGGGSDMGGGSAMGGGGGGTPMTHLAFVTPPISILVNSCTMDVAVEARDPNDQPLTQASALTVALSAQSGSGIGFHGNGCGGNVASVTIAAGSSQTRFRLTVGNAGMWQITASSAGFVPAVQTETVTLPVASTLVFTSAPQTLNAGQCSGPLTVQQQDGTGGSVAAATAVTVNLSSAPATVSPFTFYKDAACTMPTSSATIPVGSSSVSVYASGYTGTQYTLSAAAMGLSNASQTLNIRPWVRRGLCVLDAMTANRACTIAPPQQNVANTMFVFQATSSTVDLGAAAVRCDVAATNQVLCSRTRAGSVVNVQWQTLEMPGLSVGRFTGYCPNDGGTGTVIPTTAAGSFVLTSASTDSMSLDSTTLYTAQKTGNLVQLNWGQPCGSTTTPFEVIGQLVSLTGTTMVQLGGGLGQGVGQLQLPTGLPGAGSTVLTGNTTDGLLGVLCDQTVRGTIIDGGIALSRGDGMPSGPSCTLSNVQLSGGLLSFNNVATVQQVSTALHAGVASAVVPLGRAVDVTRTLVFSSSQAGGAGQGAGESALAMPGPLGDIVAAHVLDGGAAFDSKQLILARDSTLGDAVWTSYVVELGP